MIRKGQFMTDQDKHAPDPMSLERHQPDPMLQMSTGRLHAAGIALVAVAIAVILGVVLYGLNSATEASHAPASPSAETSAGAQAPAPAPPEKTSPGNG
jgi:negative regulator of sigma E activity